MLDFKYRTNKRNLIILVHGLLGSDKTWGEDYPLYSLLLKDEIIKNNYDIATFSYYSHFTSENMFFHKIRNLRGGKIKRNLSIKEISKIFETSLGIEKRDYDNIIFIGHSMGGLIGKEYIINNRGVIDMYISIATPHHGSEYGKFALAHNQAKNLKINNKALEILNNLWISSSELPKDFYFYGSYDNVVPVESAIPKTKENYSNCYAFPEDHFSIVKPENENSLFYKKLKQVLTDFVDETNFERIILHNFSKMQLNSEYIINDLRSHSYSLKNTIEIEHLKSIFNYTSSSTDLLSKDSLKDFVDQYSQYLCNYLPKIKEVAFVGISLIPLSVLEGFVLRTVNSKRYFVNYNHGEIGYRELNDIQTPRITFSYKISESVTESVCIKIQSSFPMEDSSINDIYPDFDIVEISANTVSRDNITGYSEILEFKNKFRKLLSELKIKGVTQIHLFIGAPVCINIACGEVIQTHDPEVIVYNYLNGKYDWGLNLTNREIITLELGGKK